MFIDSSLACSEHNSQTPITQQQIDDEQAFLDSVDTAFDEGNAALNDLIETLGGNPLEAGSGSAGVPTTGTLNTDIAGIPVIPSAAGAPALQMLPSLEFPASWVWAPSPDDPANSHGALFWGPGGSSGAGWPWDNGGGYGGSGWRAPQHQIPNRRSRSHHQPQTAPTSSVPGNCPIVIPLVNTIPVPAGPAPVSMPPSVLPAAAPSVSAPPSPALVTIPVPPPADCRTGNTCLDIMRGCILASQVSAAQLQACSEAGYAGNQNLFPAIAAAGGAGGGAYFGTPQPGPSPYQGSGLPAGVPAPVPINYAGYGPMGVSGLGQDSAAQTANATIFSNSFEYIVSGLVTVAALAILSKGIKSR